VIITKNQSVDLIKEDVYTSFDLPFHSHAIVIVWCIYFTCNFHYSDYTHRFVHRLFGTQFGDAPKNVSIAMFLIINNVLHFIGDMQRFNMNSSAPRKCTCALWS